MTRSAAKRSNRNASEIAARVIDHPQLVQSYVHRGGVPVFVSDADAARQLANRNGWQCDETNWAYVAERLHRDYRLTLGMGSVRPRRNSTQRYPMLWLSDQFFERRYDERPIFGDPNLGYA